MHTGIISFCDQSGLNVKSHDVKEAITKTLENKYRQRIIQRHYEKLDRPGQLPKLKANPHLVCLRSNGNPYYLFLTRYQFVNQCFFVDKKVQGGYDLPRVIVSKLRFSDELFEEDTLMEGEMVRDAAGNWIYLIHDLLVYKGRYLETEPVVKRLNLVYELLENGFKADDMDVCAVHVKKYVTYDRIRELVEEVMPALPYTCRGLYFKPLYLRFLDFLFNFDESLIVKVERIKYQKMNGFNATTEEVVQASGSGTPIAPLVPVAPLTLPPGPEKKAKSTTTAALEASPKPKIRAKSIEDGTRNLLMEKTHLVDVYNLLDPATKKPVGLASIVQASISRMFQEVFAPVNPTTRFMVRCSFNERFQKWMPLQLASTATAAT
jgi:hypothetical protein